MTLGSLFSGIGGFEYAATLTGVTPVWASEIVPTCISITKRHFPELKHYGDITKLHGAKIEPVDIITFGSPCQDMSQSGKREGIRGEQSILFFEAIRIIKEMRNATNGRYPRFCVWENVAGSFSSEGGEDFKTVIQEISQIAEDNVSIPEPSSDQDGRLIWEPAGAVLGDGWSLAWRQLDSRYWGVPQRRKRIFLVADFRGESAPSILFAAEGVSRYSKSSSAVRENSPSSIGRGIDPAVQIKPSFILNDQGGGSIQVESSEISPTLRSEAHGNLPIVVNQYAVDFGRTGDRIQMNPEVAVTLQGEGGGGAGKVGLYCLPSFYQYQRLSDFKESQEASTVQARDYKSPRDLVLSYGVRRLTPLECERLFGYPDGWTEFGHDDKKISDSARYRALGNSVAIPCVEFILQSLLALCKKLGIT